MTVLYVLYIILSPHIEEIVVAAYPTEEACRADLGKVRDMKAPVIGRCKKVPAVEFAK